MMSYRVDELLAAGDGSFVRWLDLNRDRSIFNSHAHS
jgi:hypothetical protein